MNLTNLFEIAPETQQKERENGNEFNAELALAVCKT